MKIESEEEMLAFGRQFAKDLKVPCVIELIGDVGAGKTTFTRGLAQGLNVDEAITSPSFMISKRYLFPLQTKQGEPTYGNLIHYDFYRLPDPGIMRAELDETLLMDNSVIVVEWAESVADVLPETRTCLTIELEEDSSRTVHIK